MPTRCTAGFPYRRHNVSGHNGCFPFIVTEAKIQSVWRLYGPMSLTFSSDSARAASSGTSLADRLGLRSSLNHHHYRSPNVNQQLLEIHVLPLQTDQFAAP